MTKINNSPRIPLDEFKVMKGTIAHLRSYDDKWRAARGLTPREEKPTQPTPAQTSAPTQPAPTQTSAETVSAQSTPTPTMSDIIRTIITGDETTNANLNENANAPTNNEAPTNASTMLGIELDDIKAILSSPIVKELAKGVKALVTEMLMSLTQETAPTEEKAEPVQPTEETPVEEVTNEVPAEEPKNEENVETTPVTTEEETAPTEETTVEVPAETAPTEETAIEETATEEAPAEETPAEVPAQPENQPEQTTPLIAYYKEKLEEYKNGSQKMNEAPVEEKAEEEPKAEEARSKNT